MAKEAGRIKKAAYVSPSITVRTDTSRKSNTEAGLTEAQRKTLAAEESRIRTQNVEHGVVIDEDGKVVSRHVGNRGAVNIDVKENSVVTHNHPGADLRDTESVYGRNSTGIAGRVGRSFSAGDIRETINGNAKEVRAVTRTYTFSLKRPAGGWGISGAEAEREYRSILTKLVTDGKSVPAARTKAEQVRDYARETTVLQHVATRELARRHGWRYTRRRN